MEFYQPDSHKNYISSAGHLSVKLYSIVIRSIKINILLILLFKTSSGYALLIFSLQRLADWSLLIINSVDSYHVTSACTSINDNGKFKQVSYKTIWVPFFKYFLNLQFPKIKDILITIKSLTYSQAQAGYDFQAVVGDNTVKFSFPEWWLDSSFCRFKVIYQMN